MLNYLSSVRPSLSTCVWGVCFNLSWLGVMVSSESGRRCNPDGRQGLTLQEDIKPLNCHAGWEWQGMLCSKNSMNIQTTFIWIFCRRHVLMRQIQFRENTVEYWLEQLTSSVWSADHAVPVTEPWKWSSHMQLQTSACCRFRSLVCAVTITVSYVSIRAIFKISTHVFLLFLDFSVHIVFLWTVEPFRALQQSLVKLCVTNCNG